MAVILAVTSADFGGDGWESNPPRTPHSAPQTVLKTAGGTSPRTSPAGKMLFRQWDADALDAERLGVPGQEADQEAQHAIDLRGPSDGGDQGGLRGPKSAKTAVSRDLGVAACSGREERDPDASVTVAGVNQDKGALPPNLPGTNLLPVDPTLQRGQEAFPTRIPTGVDRNLHG
jgi:hypothetical protein